MAKSGAFIFQRSVREKWTRENCTQRAQLPEKYTKITLLPKTTPFSQQILFIPPAITILHQRYTDVSFRLNICAKSPFACFFI